MCGIAGIFDELPNDAKSQKGFKAAVLGTIPPSAGLSSSSALVCAAAIAAARIFSVEKTKLEFAELAAKCERYIGTQGGGMDQAIAILATPGIIFLHFVRPLKKKKLLGYFKFYVGRFPAILRFIFAVFPSFKFFFFLFFTEFFPYFLNTFLFNF